MKVIIEDFLNNIRSGWRFRWYAILLAWMIALVGWGVVYLIPDKFQATTRVYVDTKSVLKPLLKGLAVESDIKEQLAIMTRTLLSRPKLERVIREAELGLLAKSEEQRDLVLRKLRSEIYVSSGDGKNLFTIQYIHKDIEVAKKVVQELLNIFIESSVGDERAEAETATLFLNEQIASYEKKLSAAEDRLTEFKRRNVGMLPGQDGGIFQRHQKLEEQHKDALLKFDEAKYQRDVLNVQLQGLLKQKSYAEPAQFANRKRVYALEQKLDDLLLKYTDEHPNVVEIKRKIAVLKKQLKIDAAKIDEGEIPKGVGAIGENKALDQLKLQLATAEANMAALTVRGIEYKRRVEVLNRQMDIIPKVEAELTRLNRDYTVNKKNYDLMTQRRESASISKEVDEAGDSVKFRVIDPPHVPATAVSPNRMLLSAVVLLASFGGGGALAFLLSQMNPVFYDTSTLRREMEYPVFGSVSRVWTSELTKKRRIEVSLFIVLVMLLCGLCLLIEAIYYFDGTDKLLAKIRRIL